MIKKSIIQRGIKKYFFSKKYYSKRLVLKNKSKKFNNLLNIFKIQKNFQKLPKNSTFIRFNRFCWKTGRHKGYFRIFGVSRHVLREMAHNCNLPGLKKASW